MHVKLYFTERRTLAEDVGEQGKEKVILVQRGAGKRGPKESLQSEASKFLLLAKFLGYQIKKNEMGGACGMYGRGLRYTYSVLLGKPEGKNTWKT